MISNPYNDFASSDQISDVGCISSSKEPASQPLRSVLTRPKYLHRCVTSGGIAYNTLSFCLDVNMVYLSSTASLEAPIRLSINTIEICEFGELMSCNQT